MEKVYYSLHAKDQANDVYLRFDSDSQRKNFIDKHPELSIVKLYETRMPIEQALMFEAAFDTY